LPLVAGGSRVEHASKARPGEAVRREDRIDGRSFIPTTTSL